MRFVLLGCGVVAVPWLLAYGMAWIARRCQDKRDPVHRLIAEKGAKPITRMEKPDWTLIARAGSQRWHEALAAQMRYVQVPQPGTSDDEDEENDHVKGRQPGVDDDGTTWLAGSRFIN